MEDYKSYFRTIHINAYPLTLGEHKEYVKEPVAETDDLDAAGYQIVDKRHNFSWMPASEFDAEYQSRDAMSFGHAIRVLNLGLKVARQGWNGKGMWLKLQEPTESSEMTLPFISMKTADENHVPWLASQTDILANDWMIVE